MDGEVKENLLNDEEVKIMNEDEKDGNEIIVEKITEKKDFLKLVFFGIVLEGVGMLFPYQALISAPDYFNKIFGPQMMFYILLAYSFPALCGLIFYTFFGRRIPLVIRATLGYIVGFVILILLPMLGFFKVTGTWGFMITLILTVGIALVTSTVESSTYGLAAMFPSYYMTAILTGNGIAGVITVSIRILTKLIFNLYSLFTGGDGQSTIETATLSSSIYFFVGAGVVLLCLIVYFLILVSPYTKYVLQTTQDKIIENAKEWKIKKIRKMKENVLKKVQRGKNIKEIENQLYFDEKKEEEKIKQNLNILKKKSEQKDILNEEEMDEMIELILLPPEKINGEEKFTLKSFLYQTRLVFYVFSKIWHYCFFLFLNFFVTLSVYPALTVVIPSSFGGFMNEWLQIILVLTYAIFDCIVRMAPNIIKLFNKRWIGHATCIRVLFIPLFIMCVNPRIIQFDLVPVILVALLAVSNGYCCALIIMYAPEEIEQEYRQIPGTMMPLFLLLGCTCGSLCGIVFSKLLL